MPKYMTSQLLKVAIAVILRATGGFIGAAIAYIIWTSLPIAITPLNSFAVAYLGFWSGWLSSAAFFKDVYVWFTL